MRSPTTGKEMVILDEDCFITFRGIQVPYVHSSYQCTETGLTFTNTELDTENLKRMNYNFNKLHKERNKNKETAIVLISFIIVGLILMMI